MHLPNYKNGSIVNLMATLARSFNGQTQYQPLKGLDGKIFSGKNVVLMVIDGLGYEFLKKYGRGSFLEKNLKQKITSVFPSTTATAVTAFLTGVPAQQHGLTGWFMYFRKLNTVIRVLPFTTREGRIPLSEKGVKFNDIFKTRTIFEKINAAGYAIQPEEIVDSESSLALARGANQLSFTSLQGFFKAIKKALKQKTGRKFIYSYWDGPDAFSHKYGCASPQTLKHFKILDKQIKSFAGKLKNAVLVITADHGFIDTEPGKIIELSDHPALAETLSQSLCGEPRTAYCYVKPEKKKQFENYVRKNFKRSCELFKSRELIKRNFFGLFKANPEIYNRVGDYTLIMKENYIIKDFVKNEKYKICTGNHGGVSKEEMFVPLVVINK